MRHSELPLRYKVLTITMFVGIMSVVWYLARAFALSLPDYLLFPIATGIICLAAGVVIGDKSARAHLRNDRTSSGL